MLKKKVFVPGNDSAQSIERAAGDGDGDGDIDQQ